jgi:glycosyltransferase involved in cell wall biosynthesis
VRVLMLSKALVTGVYQTKVEEMARLPGVEITLVVPPYWREGKQLLGLQRAHMNGYQMTVIDMALNGHYHLHYYPALGSIVRRIRPDIFHIDEEPYNLATYLAMRIGRKAGARCLFFTWQNLYRPQAWNLFERYNLAHADAAIAGNTEAAAVLQRKGFHGPVSVIPQFGVDPAIYRPLPDTRAGRALPFPQAANPTTFVIGYLGRLVEQKGLPVLLEAVAGLTGDWQLLIIGDGPLRAQLEAQAAKLGVAGRVNVLPAMPSTDVPQWLNLMDCLVLPSLTRPNWKEQFGRVLIEAMACEVPIVGSNSGEIPGVVGDAGLIAREGDALHLREQLALLMANSDLRRRLGTLGRERVLAHFTQARVAEATVHFYQQVLGGA